MMTLTDKIFVVAILVASAVASITMLYWLMRLALFVWGVL